MNLPKKSIQQDVGQLGIVVLTVDVFKYIDRELTLVILKYVPASNLLPMLALFCHGTLGACTW